MGKSSPAPPPDYTAEKREIREATEADYATRAADYNTAVNNYNTALSGYQSSLSDLGGNIGGMSIADLYDDPTTSENENRYRGFMDTLSGLSSNLGGLSVGMDRPVFESSVNSEYGPIGITNIPDLTSANTQLYDTLTGDLSNYQRQLNNLLSDRQAEEQRIRDFRSNQLTSLGGYSSQAGQLGIGDINQINQLDRDLAALNTGRNAFSSTIMDQMYPGGFSQVNQQAEGIQNTLNDLRTQRQAELDRISAFESGLLGQADSFRDTLGGLTIADEGAIADAIRDIEAQQRAANRFSSELGFDFSQETGELGELLRDAQGLQTERERELARIEAARNRFLNESRDAERAAETGSIYSAAGLDALDDRIRDLRTDMGGFSSALDFDFSGGTGNLSDAEAALASLRERRAGEIDSILSGVTAAGAGIGDIDLSDEAAIRARATELNDLNQRLSPFSGGRVNDIQTQLRAGLDAVDGRLAELQARRAELETQAAALAEQVRNQQFYAADDLIGSQGSFDALQAEIELFGAQQAMDELAQAEQRLQGERQRLEADAEAVALRETQGQQDLLATIGASGLPEFQDFNQVDPMTLEQYLNLLANNEEEEFPLGLSPTAFSQNLGVIRA